MAKLETEAPIIYHLRNGNVIGTLPFLSLNTKATLAEASISEVEIDSRYACSIKNGDTIRVTCNTCEIGDFTVSEFSTDFSSDHQPTMISLSPCVNALRCTPIPSNTIFQGISNVQAFNAIIDLVSQDGCLLIPVEFRNVSTQQFGARVNLGGANALEAIRALCAATGNTFTWSNNGCKIIVGTMGQKQNIYIRSGSNIHSDPYYFAKSMTITRDHGEVYGCAYVEGGNYTIPLVSDPTKTETVTLSIGSDKSGNSYLATTPSGYTISQVIRLGKSYYKMCKNNSGDQCCATTISVGGITPKTNSIPDQIEAANLLAKIAANYLEQVSVENITVEVEISGLLCGLILEDKVHVEQCCDDGSKAISDWLYVVDYEFLSEGDRSYTRLKLSTRLFDPQDMLDVTNTNKDDNGNVIPYQAIGEIVNQFSVFAFNSNQVCGTDGRVISVDYSATGYQTTPVISVNLPSGYTYSIISANSNSSTICIVPTSPPFSPSGVNCIVTVVGSV